MMALVTISLKRSSALESSSADSWAAPLEATARCTWSRPAWMAAAVATVVVTLRPVWRRTSSAA